MKPTLIDLNTDRTKLIRNNDITGINRKNNRFVIKGEFIIMQTNLRLKFQTKFDIRQPTDWVGAPLSRANHRCRRVGERSNLEHIMKLGVDGGVKVEVSTVVDRQLFHRMRCYWAVWSTGICFSCFAGCPRNPFCDFMQGSLDVAATH